MLPTYSVLINQFGEDRSQRANVCTIGTSSSVAFNNCNRHSSAIRGRADSNVVAGIQYCNHSISDEGTITAPGKSSGASANASSSGMFTAKLIVSV